MKFNNLHIYVYILFRLLVGAPRDNITDTDSNVLKRITRPGVIYTCPLTSLQDDCDTVKINRDGKQ